MITPTATRNTTRSGHPTDLTHLRHHLLVLWNTLKMILGYPDYHPRELLLRAFSVRIPISEYSTPDPAALVILKTIPSTTSLVSAWTEGLDPLGFDEPHHQILQQPHQYLSVDGRKRGVPLRGGKKAPQKSLLCR